MWKEPRKRTHDAAGYSRDHRPDCEQLVLALIVNQDGFSVQLRTLRWEPRRCSTVEAILRTVERNMEKHAEYGSSTAAW